MTLTDLRNRFAESVPARILMDMTFASNSAEQVRAVEDAIDYIAQDMVRHRQAYQEKKEDELTIYIVACLRSMGFRAAHDTQFGGHCDIVVEGRESFLWIAEAKIYRGYSKLIEGIHQLNFKYGTGLRNQSNADLIIYHYEKRVDIMLREWLERIRKEFPNDVVSGCDRDDLSLRSIHLHESTGREFFIRHKAIPLQL
ncbi:hypothetical protein [Asticcacaulis machinosus]|uniref:Restriction endonuclease type IV Mrr domain-containing protein n=1 Tax=Asticcacaulis machinosus TaxID=2984211 RepID=A0ABT5HFZ3_9CAUL|nr:hypothetical protein [Asticcacaulis machinosus]MDC7675181.1 hypothetical protein [Asticcacaulis machinosus]